MQLRINIERGPLDVDSSRVQEANTFQLGNLLALTSSGFSLADNTSGEGRAVAFVIHASASEYRIVATMEMVPWPSHGQGTMGDRLWLGTAGGYTTTEPRGSAIRVVQEVAIVVDDNNLLVFPPTPFMI